MHSAAAALEAADYVIHAIPVVASADFFESSRHLIRPGVPIISASKGITADTLENMAQLLPRCLRNPAQPLALISGPSFARELLRDRPTAVVVAAADEGLRSAVQALFASPVMRVYVFAVTVHYPCSPLPVVRVRAVVVLLGCAPI